MDVFLLLCKKEIYMKNRIYRSIKQFFIMLSICTILFSGPVASNEVSKMLKCMDERNSLIRELDEAENDEDNGDKRKGIRHRLVE
jgi:hypothetical protein